MFQWCHPLLLQHEDGGGDGDDADEDGEVR